MEATPIQSKKFYAIHFLGEDKRFIFISHWGIIISKKVSECQLLIV